MLIIKNLVIALLLLIHVILLAIGATLHSPTKDEVGHFAAGISHWETGRFALYRVNPPLIRLIATLPVVALGSPLMDWQVIDEDPRLRPEMSLGAYFIKEQGESVLWSYTIARWACIPFSILGACVCYLWSKEQFGDLGGLISLTLWCFCPTIIGHGQLITPDVGATSFGVAASYTFWRWLKNPSWVGSVGAGIVLGLTELTKTTWIILFFAWPALWLFSRFSMRASITSRQLFKELGQLSAIALCSIYIINAAYLFEGSFKKLGHYRFISNNLSAYKNSDLQFPAGSNRFAGTWLGELPVPVPSNYLQGIDVQKHDFEINIRPNFLRGEWSKVGWKYYYLYALLIKVPLGTSCLVFLAIILRIFVKIEGRSWRDDVFLLAVPLVILIMVSLQTGINRHLRYVLPLFPFVFIFAGSVAAWNGPRLGLIKTIVALCLIWLVSSSLHVYPHSLSYFNELVGGPSGGHNHLLGSNFDWGQDLVFLKNWQLQHPEAKPFWLVYNGSIDPKNLGINYKVPPTPPNCSEISTHTDLQLASPMPGWYAIRVELQHIESRNITLFDGGGGSKRFKGPCYKYFWRRKPIAMAGYTIAIYHVTLDEANIERRRLGLPPLTSQNLSEVRFMNDQSDWGDSQ